MKKLNICIIGELFIQGLLIFSTGVIFVKNMSKTEKRTEIPQSN